MPTLRDRLTSAMRGLRFPSVAAQSGGGWRGLVPGSAINYEIEAGPLDSNAIVAASIGWIVRVFPEAPIKVYDTGGPHGPVMRPKHAVADLLVDPNPYYTGRTLWQGTLNSLHLDGNAYWLKVRNRYGKVLELWYVPHTLMGPLWKRDGTDFLNGFDYAINGQHYTIDPGDVVHFRLGGFDPYNLRKGIAPLKAAYREVYSDNAAANYSASMLRNMGRPFVVISPADPMTVIDQDTADDVERKYNAKSTGDQMGGTMVMKGATKVDVMSFNPAEMTLTALRRLPEERIAALLGVPPIVIGLGVGLERATYSNYKQAREAAYDQAILPLYSLLADQLTQQLLPDFDDTADRRMGFDTSGIKALQDDQTTVASRAALLFNADILKLDDARVAVGLPPDPVFGGMYRSQLYPSTGGAQRATALAAGAEPPLLDRGGPDVPPSPPKS